MSTTARINKLVRLALPKGKPVKIIWRSTGLANSQTLRVVTPAWKELPRSSRISKLQQAIDSKLSPRERARIFRISVLTPAEFKRLAGIVPQRHLSGRTILNGRPKATTG